MTKTDLLILGLLVDKPMHGYEIEQLLKAEGIKEWFNVSMPSIYYSLKKLAEEGLVVESVLPGGKAPSRNIYQLTEEGRMAFFKVMKEKLASPEQCALGHELEILFINKLPLEEALNSLEKRKTALSQRLRSIQDKVGTNAEKTSPGRAFLQHLVSHIELDIHWLDNIIRCIKAGHESLAEISSPGRGLMLLSGDLRDYHFPDLLRLIASGSHSGTITVTDGISKRTLSFHRGKPVCATSARYVNGRLDYVADPEQVMKDIFDLFRWQEGAFTFDQTMGPEEGCTVIKMNVENFILQGTRWVDSWDIIRHLVPSSEMVFEICAEPEKLEALELEEREKAVLRVLDGLKDVAAVAREIGLSLFDTSKIIYCLAAVGVVRPANLEKIRLRRAFREISELLCQSTYAWRTAPDDFSCEEQVNEKASHLPICLNHSRIEDRTDPRLSADKLAQIYREFLSLQLEVVSNRFGPSAARSSFQNALKRLAPDLYKVAVKFGLTSLLS